MTCDEPRKVLKPGCVGHVQKCVGNRIHKLKKRFHGLGDKGKLTEAITARRQNYCDISIRSNKDDIPGMKTAIYASLFHVESSQDNNWPIALKANKVGVVTKEINQSIRTFINRELGCQKKSSKKLNRYLRTCLIISLKNVSITNQSW